MKVSTVGFALAMSLMWAAGISLAVAAPAPGAPTYPSPAATSNAKGAKPARSAGQVVSDVTITAKVKAALIKDKTVPAGKINVDTVKGVVHLRGNVDNKTEAQRAVAVAKKVQGVKGVKNELKVGTPAKTSKK